MGMVMSGMLADFQHIGIVQITEVADMRALVRKLAREDTNTPPS
jgi:hypothetical protein